MKNTRIATRTSAASCSVIGNAISDKGRNDEAIAEYKKAIELKPDFPEARRGLAEVLAVKDH
jgi:cytochrome c-type biogenesis protein CcmH/NrfG